MKLAAIPESNQKAHLAKLIELKRKRGYWHSPETIEKISESAKGRLAWNKGKKVSAAERQAMSERMKAHTAKLTAEGKRPGNFKGGCWDWWRQEILKRDDYTCQVCGLQEPVIMEVTHIQEIKGLKNRVTSGHELNSYENLITLCPNDHKRFDKGLIAEEELNA